MGHLLERRGVLHFVQDDTTAAHELASRTQEHGQGFEGGGDATDEAAQVDHVGKG